MTAPAKCKQCWGKGYMKVRNPTCHKKTVRLPCDRCRDTGVDPGEHVPMEALPYIDLDVQERSQPGFRRVIEM